MDPLPTSPTESSELLPSEAAVLQRLSVSDAQVSQRGLAESTGLSIGLINAILKRLTQIGYIKIINLNRRQLQYLLTPAGLAATSKQAYNYVVRTFQNYRSLREQILVLFDTLCDRGLSQVYVEGDPELKSFLRVVMQEGGYLTKLAWLPTPTPECTVVNLKGAVVTTDGPRLDMEIREVPR